MNDNLQLSLHSINATLLMIFGILAINSGREAGEIGGLIIMFGVAAKCFIAFKRFVDAAHSLPPKTPPPDLPQSSPLDVD